MHYYTNNAGIRLPGRRIDTMRIDGDNMGTLDWIGILIVFVSLVRIVTG